MATKPFSRFYKSFPIARFLMMACQGSSDSAANTFYIPWIREYDPYDPVSQKLIHRGRQQTYAYTPKTDSYEALHHNSVSW